MTNMKKVTISDLIDYLKQENKNSTIVKELISIIKDLIDNNIIVKHPNPFILNFFDLKVKSLYKTVNNITNPRDKKEFIEIDELLHLLIKKYGIHIEIVNYV